jgi:outer membrane protein OmpA-like peptidoglycan-associated protein/opacity protein-like surface antigen
MKLRNALLAATILAAPAAAIAQPVTGPYVSLGVGANYLQNQNIRDFSVPALGAFSPGYNGHLSTNTDVMGSAAFGYGLGNGIRIELQGDYRQNSLHSFAGLSATGQEQSFGGFANVLYDFDLSPFGVPLSPYVGVGAGYNQIKFSNGGFSGYGGTAGNIPVFIRETNTQGDFAAQGILGVAYNIPQVPGLALTVEGRVMGIPQDQSFHGQFFATNIPLSQRAYYKLSDTINYSGLVGLRYALFQPPPPPPPVQPPPQVAPPEAPVTRTYLVFFDWDRADLTARARQIVAQAAAASTKVQTTRIEVNGYTDLSGTAAYNQKLSVRRARSVESELIRDGVAQGEISIHGYGESNPLVPTAPGVREPQNRRVEIILK